MILRLIDGLSGFIRTLATLAIIALFLWLAGAVDAGTMGRLGRYHAQIVRNAHHSLAWAVGVIPWQVIMGLGLLALLGAVVILTWGHIKRLYLQNRSVNVELID